MDILSIIHLCCYLLALIPSTFFAFSIDYSKIIKARANSSYYIALILVTVMSTYLVGEFTYKIITMFVK